MFSWGRCSWTTCQSRPFLSEEGGRELFPSGVLQEQVSRLAAPVILPWSNRGCSHLQCGWLKSRASFSFVLASPFFLSFEYMEFWRRWSVVSRAVNSQEVTSLRTNLGLIKFMLCHLKGSHSLPCKESKPHGWLSWSELWMPCWLSGCSCK